MKILITGGAGYIGSTVAAAMERRGYHPIILDSLITGQRRFINGRSFYEGDIADERLLGQIFAEHADIAAVIHCAALIVVPDSIVRPWEYYTENVVKSLALLRFLCRSGCRRFIFSSSASIYDTSGEGFQVTEASPCRPSNPYARTKFIGEMIIQDFCRSYGMQGVSLRYFNPIGADLEAGCGPHHRNSMHVLDKILAVAVGEERQFHITGVDYPTRDGTGLRDYIHVLDIATAHLRVVECFDEIVAGEASREHFCTINLGRGEGVTVRELVAACSQIVGYEIPIVEAPPRPGDVAGAYANTDRALRLLAWEAQYDLKTAIRHAIDWLELRVPLLGY